MKKLFYLVSLLALSGSSVIAQTTVPVTTTPLPVSSAPVPNTNTFNFSIGANALGLGVTTPASDITLSLNPGFSGFAKNFELRSDNLLSPGANLQYYGGGVNFNLPFKFPTTSALAPLSFYVDITVGADRIVPANGVSRSHVGYMGGGGLRWTTSSGVKINLIEINNIHTPGAPWGNNAPAVSSGLSYVFGHQ